MEAGIDLCSKSKSECTTKSRLHPRSRQWSSATKIELQLFLSGPFTADACRAYPFQKARALVSEFQQIVIQIVVCCLLRSN